MKRDLFNALQESSFTRELAGDPVNNSGTRTVSKCFYSKVIPSPVAAPRWVLWSDELAEELGIESSLNLSSRSLSLLSGNLGNKVPWSYSMRYGGHQFGTWADQLGDGRVINLGAVIGFDKRVYEIQLKGAGPTPYSRRGDGRAVLRSSLREFLCSEAMYALGVPTTRALSLVETGDPVTRDMFYDGNPEEEPGAIVSRVAESFIRFGNFEILAAYDEKEEQEKLLKYVLSHHFKSSKKGSSEAPYLWFEELVHKTASLVAAWMGVGFVHGVLNTDNMSILGDTIDYGPFGWIEPYEPDWTPNTTDFAHHRYGFGNQPHVALWNLGALASSLTLILPDTKALQNALTQFNPSFKNAYESLVLRKLGLSQPWHGAQAPLHTLLETLRFDLTLFYRYLSHAVEKELSLEDAIELLAKSSYLPVFSPEEHSALKEWLSGYFVQLTQEAGLKSEIGRNMARVNPKYVLRNYLTHTATKRYQEGDRSFLDALYQVIRHPFDEHPEHDSLAQKRPSWADSTPGCSALSCSS